MAGTLWVSTLGTDTANGSTYALAKKTVGDTVDAVTASMTHTTINVVNDGTHILPTTQSTTWASGSQFGGTDWETDFGLRIRGTDSTGELALATVANVGTNDAWFARRMQVGAAYWVVEGIHFDFSAGCTTVNFEGNAIVQGSGGADDGGVCLRYCKFTGGVKGTARAIYRDSGDYQRNKVEHCVFINPTAQVVEVLKPSANENFFQFNQNFVYINQVRNIAQFIRAQASITGTEFEFKHNSFVIYLDNTAQTISTGAFVDGRKGDTGGSLVIEDNLVWIGTDGDGGSLGTTAMQAAFGYTGTQPSAHFTTRTGDSNRLITGPGITNNATLLGPGGWYDGIFDPEGEIGAAGSGATNLYTNDATASTTAATLICTGLTTSVWTWMDVNGSGYDIPLPGDWRATVYAGSASDGGTIGALFSAVSIPPVEADPISPEFIDVAPFFAPDLDVDFRLSMKTKRNRRKHDDLGFEIKTTDWEEKTGRLMVIGTNVANQQITLGGIATAEHFMVQTDQDISLSINGTTNHWPVSDVLALSSAAITSLYVTNASTANEATVRLIAIN